MRERARSQPADLIGTPDDGSPAMSECSDEEDETTVTEISVYGSFIPPAPLLKGGDGEDVATSLQTLRMDGCVFRGNALEALGEYLFCTAENTLNS